MVGARVGIVMKNRTVTITVAASYDDVFSFLANPRTLPEWAHTFSKSISQKNGAWEVVTPQGVSLAFAIEADRASGCIEMLAGPTPEQMESFPIRVYKADNGQTVASFTMFKSQRPGLTDAMFDDHYRQLVAEVEGLLPRFGGGEMSSGLPTTSRLAVGIVSANVAASRDFYVTHLGFQAVFDSPFYVHLVRQEGGEQLGLMAPENTGHAEFESATNGSSIWLMLEVDDVDAEFERLSKAGLSFRESPKDQPWGDRTAVFSDPDGVLIYLTKPTRKMDESLKQFVVTVEPELVS